MVVTNRLSTMCCRWRMTIYGKGYYKLVPKIVIIKNTWISWMSVSIGLGGCLYYCYYCYWCYWCYCYYCYWCYCQLLMVANNSDQVIDMYMCGCYYDVDWGCSLMMINIVMKIKNYPCYFHYTCYCYCYLCLYHL